MHRAAVVAEKYIEAGEQRGEATDGRGSVGRDQVSLRVRTDLFDESLFPRAGGEEDLRADLILEAVADRGESLGGPDAMGAAAAGMNQDPQLRIADRGW